MWLDSGVARIGAFTVRRNTVSKTEIHQSEWVDCMDWMKYMDGLKDNMERR